MKQPDFSNKAQEAQEQQSAADAARLRKEIEDLGPRRKTGDGAVHGGEAAKPGQMDGDADVAVNAPAKSERS